MPFLDGDDDCPSPASVYVAEAMDGEETQPVSLDPLTGLTLLLAELPMPPHSSPSLSLLFGDAVKTTFSAGTGRDTRRLWPMMAERKLANDRANDGATNGAATIAAVRQSFRGSVPRSTGLHRFSARVGGRDHKVT